MFHEKKILAVLLARGGSKGLPGKNLKEIGGKPLLAWSIEEAKKSKYIDRVILSSEDAKIMEVAKQWGCDVPFVRPAELSEDHVSGVEPVLHAIRTLNLYDYVVLLQPTSPLRQAQDIDGCIELCINKELPCVVSVTETDKSPFWMYQLDEMNRMHPILDLKTRPMVRQAFPKVYMPNGAVYVAQTKWLEQTRTFITEETVAYPMPKARSVDIDTELDWILFEALVKKNS